MSTQPDGFAHAIQYLTGETHALCLFRAAVARAHPDPDALLPQMDRAEQRGLAHIEALPLSDAAYNEYRFLFDNVRRVMG
ncbi:MAG TPA: hypothetical protein VKI44_33295 [Acetobacteraceae bacterium]|nr:hypothetical protein [Acetobacteraceae bacterium]